MKKEITLLAPLMPNFIMYKVSAGLRQDGIDFDRNKMPVSELSEKEAEEYGQLMKMTFIKHWERLKLHKTIKK